MVLGLVYVISRLVRSHGRAVSIRIAAMRRAVSVKCRTSSGWLVYTCWQRSGVVRAASLRERVRWQDVSCKIKAELSARPFWKNLGCAWR